MKKLYDITMLKNKEGATLKHYTCMKYKYGYQVSIQDHYKGTCVEEAFSTIQKLNGCCGCWWDNEEKVYCVDYSIHTYSLLVALVIGIIKKQKAIYCWHFDFDIRLKKEEEKTLQTIDK